MGHGIYAVPLANTPPELAVVLADEVVLYTDDALPPAVVGEPWIATVEALDADGTQFFWQLVQAPPGMSLLPLPPGEGGGEGTGGYHQRAVLSWTPSPAAAASTGIVLRVQDSRGGWCCGASRSK